jgi:hypothetical protein
MTKVSDIRAAGDLIIEKKALPEPLAAQEGIGGQLARFPEEVYNLTVDSHLYRLINALAGEAGAGSIKKEMLLPKLQQMLDSTHFRDLDLLYGNPMGLPRISLENYDFDPQGTPLTQAQWQEVRAKDADYRSRCLKWMRAVLHGATLEGIALAAEAALGVECDVYERYKYLENLKSDKPANLIATWDFEDGEYANTIIARGDIPPMNAWTYGKVNGAEANPAYGSGGAAYGSRYLSATSAGTATHAIGIGPYYRLRLDTSQAYTFSAFFRRASGTGDPKARMQVDCYDEAGTLLGTVYPSGVVPGINALTGGTGSLNPNAGVTSTVWEHWGGYIAASSWPAGTATIQPLIYPYYLNSAAGTILVDAAKFEQGTEATLFGTSVPGSTTFHTEVVIVPQIPEVTAQERRRCMRLVDRLRPMDTVITLSSGAAIRSERPAIAAASSSSAWNVQRLVTARSDQEWPAVDPQSGFWLVPGVETEAPTFAWIDRQEAATFLSVQTVTASSEKIGNFNLTQRQLFPHLASVTDPFDVHVADRSFARSFAKLNFTIPWVNRT